MICRDNTTPSWLKDFADYWKNAEGRIKQGDYISEIQRALNNKKSVDDVVKDLRARVGLDSIDEIKKESETDVNKVASNKPEYLVKNPQIYEKLRGTIESEPFISYDALKSALGYDPELDSEEMEEYVKELLSMARAGKEKEQTVTDYHIDHVDTEDNKWINYDGQDLVNKI